MISVKLDSDMASVVYVKCQALACSCKSSRALINS